MKRTKEDCVKESQFYIYNYRYTYLNVKYLFELTSDTLKSFPDQSASLLTKTVTSYRIPQHSISKWQIRGTPNRAGCDHSSGLLTNTRVKRNTSLDDALASSSVGLSSPRALCASLERMLGLTLRLKCSTCFILVVQPFCWFLERRYISAIVI